LLLLSSLLRCLLGGCLIGCLLSSSLLLCRLVRGSLLLLGGQWHLLCSITHARALSTSVAEG
jgi:hypothetical protein